MSHQLVLHQSYLLVYSVPPISVEFGDFLLIGVGFLGMGILDNILGLEDDIRFGEQGDREQSPSTDDEESIFEELEGSSAQDDESNGKDENEMDELIEDKTPAPEIVELDQRISELENEVENISASMSTLKQENEHISKSVQGMEDNIRKLLEVYEIVTRGVNPFVDDTDSQFSQPKTNFSDIIENIQHTEDSERTAGKSSGTSPEILQESPDSVSQRASTTGHAGFVDALLDAGDQAAESSTTDSDGESESVERPAEDGTQNSDEISFEQLKAEYNADDESLLSDQSAGENGSDSTGKDKLNERETKNRTESKGDVPRDVENHSESVESDQENVHFFNDAEAEEASKRRPGDDTQPSDDELGSPIDQEATSDIEKSTGSAPKRDRTEETNGTGKFEFGEKPIVDPPYRNKPYLKTVPDGYRSDLLIFEWMEQLREAASAEDSLAAVRFYETISWISSPVAEYLADVLLSLESPQKKLNTGISIRETPLDASDHVLSLRYISQLSNRERQSPTRNPRSGEEISDGL